jgi:5-oxoprolinase (ATP-hydrolysing)
MTRWRFFVDRGGTFTDCLGVDPDTGAIHHAKVLSSDDAPLTGIRRILGLDEDAALPAVDLRLGTTLATNALLERKGAPFALIITRGFGDLLEIGTQARPDLFELAIVKPPRLYAGTLEVEPRVTPSGEILGELDEETLRAGAQRFLDDGVRAAAVCVLGSYANPEIEARIAAILDELGFTHVARSCAVSAEIGMLSRGDTAALDAYLTPVLSGYLRHLEGHLGGSLLVMESSGDLVESARARGPQALLSGPAGGAVAVRALAAKHGAAQALGFDMGGTSTDVCRAETASPIPVVFEREVDGVRARAPMVDVHTVAAGGGSLCRFDGARFTVGPESAGAEPGPICYGRGGRALAITDINLALGRVRADRFPFPLDERRVRAKLEEVGAAAGMSADEAAVGFLRVANEKMADAIREVSVARGYAPADHALVVYGGAAGQHACAIASALGVTRVLSHPLAGVLSALGIGMAERAWSGERDGGRVRWDEAALSSSRASCDELAAGLGAPAAAARTDSVLLRYAGTETKLEVALEGDDDAASVRARFEAAHARRFGYARPGHAIELALLRAHLVEEGEPLSWPDDLAKGPAEPFGRARMWTGAAFEEVPLYNREDVGGAVEGPALILEGVGTIALEPGWTARPLGDGTLELTRQDERAEVLAIGEDVDPVSLELFSNRIVSIAEQMGALLRQTALSVNIRERLDFSCAVFDQDANLVANAPHIPVHLGAMSETVAAVSRAHPAPKPGASFASNDPAAGGSHLPDITVVTPVHDDGELRFWVASRGHHADVGGTTPGSMPPFSTSLEEEGVILRALPIADGAELLEADVRAAFTGAAHPARDVEQNLADLVAQLAANHLGKERLLELDREHGRAAVDAHLAAIQDDAEAKVRQALKKLKDGAREFEDALDDGTPVRVTATVSGDGLALDFSGTSAAISGNLNAPRAVTVAAVLYVVRLLAGHPIPLCAGALRPVQLHIPEGSLLDPPAGHAVCGGNVETSQRVVDVLLGALGIAAASQGTMNNLTFGNARFGYYETIAGGAGAGPGFDGASAVHTHMTNTRITDPEVLEARFPVRVERFEIARGTGGDGRFRGGDGVERVFRALEDLDVSVVSERRDRAPFGLEGGEDAAPGSNRKGAEAQPAKARFHVDAGDTFSIRTPGGGGWGPA